MAKPSQEGMENFATMMLDAGATLAIVLLKDETAALVMGDDAPPRMQVIDILRQMADQMERDEMNLVAKVQIEIDDEEDASD